MRIKPEEFLRRLYALADRLEPEAAKAYVAALQSFANRINVAELAALIQRGDIPGVLAALNLEPAVLLTVAEALRTGFVAAGTLQADALPALPRPDAPAVVVRFDMRSPYAEEWLRTLSSTRIVEILDEQREAVRETLMEGMTAGRNPRSVALDIVGRKERIVDPVTGRTRVTGPRRGGVVGLDSTKAAWVRSARAELASGDPALMRKFLARKRRDRRFDRTVLAAVKAGRPLTLAVLEKIVGRYGDSLLQLRGETIARTEMLAALNEGQRAAIRQAIDTEAITSEQVVKVWRTAADRRVRDSHRPLYGQRRRLEERFSNGLLHPHERGAPRHETIMCRCVLYHDVDFLADIAPPVRDPLGGVVERPQPPSPL
jgi:hypothetical protein